MNPYVEDHGRFNSVSSYTHLQCPYLIPERSVGSLLNAGLLVLLAAGDLHNGVDATASQLPGLQHMDTHLEVQHLVGELVPLSRLSTLCLLLAPNKEVNEINIREVIYCTSEQEYNVGLARLVNNKSL